MARADADGSRSGRHLHEAALKRQHAREQWSILSLVVPATIVIVLIILIPLSWLFYLSFLGDNGGFSLENYHKMTQYKSYYRIFVTTFQVSILTTLACIALGYPLAFFLAQLPPRWAGVFMLAVLLPFWTSLLVRTYAWLVLLQKRGILNEFAMQVGLWETPIKLVHNMTGTLIG
ncbi:MAG: ABC transporter permease, partial [Boseongicola sp.]|nr:ABC transporter permease [Boseongicola sp.]